MTELVLASASAARATLLRNAGVHFSVDPARIDEDAFKQGLRNEGVSARDLADALAEIKAVSVSRRRPETLVLGCDQTLEFDDGTMLDKADDRNALAEQLWRMSGSTHRLYSAVVCCEGGRPIWRHVERVKMTMRSLSKAFIAEYLEAEGDALLGCVGGYMIEGRGVQLFTHIEGSHFVVMGLPLLSLLDYLRVRGALTS